MAIDVARNAAVRASVLLFSLGTQDALAQGITNPAGGGRILVAIHILLGLGILSYLLIALVVKKATSKVPALPVMSVVVVVYLVIGFIEVSSSDHHNAILYLYLEMLAIMVGTIFLWVRGAVLQILGVGGVAAFVVLLNFLQPQLVDFQTRVYVDNEKDIDFLTVSYPGHWREMHLEDGRVLLNINPHRRSGGSMGMIADANKIKSPISLGDDGTDGHAVIVKLYQPVVTRGTWGWKDRPRAFYTLPLFGEVRIPRFERRLAGTALLLDENMQVACNYLYEALGQPPPAEGQDGYVTWTTEATVMDGSAVEC